MTFGEAGKEGELHHNAHSSVPDGSYVSVQGARVHNLSDVEAILDVFQAHGHLEVGKTCRSHL